MQRTGDACSHEDPLVLDGQSAWCARCGSLYGMGRWRQPERRRTEPAKVCPCLTASGDAMCRLPEGHSGPCLGPERERAAGPVVHVEIDGVTHVWTVEQAFAITNRTLSKLHALLNRMQAALSSRTATERKAGPI